MSMRRLGLAVGAAAALIAGAVVGCFSERTTAPVAEGECRFPLGEDVPGSTIVVIRDFTFTPAEVRVRAGERVTWINCDRTHTPVPPTAARGHRRCSRRATHSPRRSTRLVSFPTTASRTPS